MPGLTKRQIDATRPKDGGEIRLWDNDPRGLGIRIKSSGVKTFFIQYRSPITFRKVRYTIGQYGRLTLDEARTEAKKLFGKIKDGACPQTDKKRAKSAALSNARTISELCADYIRDANEGRVTYRGRPKKASTLAIDQGRINRHIIPLIGERLISDVTRHDVERLLHDVRLGKTATSVKTKARGKARVTGGPVAANRTVDLLGSLFSYAQREGLVAENPVSGIERLPTKRRDRVLSPAEYKSLGEVLDKFENEGGNLTSLKAYRVVALTGCRRGEIFRLLWSEVDAHNSCLRLGDTKSGQQIRPIGRAALDTIASVPKKEDSVYVFPAKQGYGHLSDAKRFRDVCKRADLKNVSLHTLRHSFASVALELGYSEMTISGLLGHRSHSVTARYAHHIDRALVTAADRVSALIAARMEGRTDGYGDVVQLRRAR